MSGAADSALRVLVSTEWAEVVGAVLRDRLGAYAEEATDSSGSTDKVALVFYPGEGASLSDTELLSLLPAQVIAQANITVERRMVPRDWVDGWKNHFQPVIVGRVRVRPPWEEPLEGSRLTDVVINPGLGFGTGLHPTTRGTLTLLQADATGAGERDAAFAATASGGGRRRLVDSGTGSGVLAIAAAKLGWGPVIAFDNDAVALASARENMVKNGVCQLVMVVECSLEEAPLRWFAGATVLANMTLNPVLVLLRRVAEVDPGRLVISGILAGVQEGQVLQAAGTHGLQAARRSYEAEWVSIELLPAGHRAEG